MYFRVLYKGFDRTEDLKNSKMLKEKRKIYMIKINILKIIKSKT